MIPNSIHVLILLFDRQGWRSVGKQGNNGLVRFAKIRDLNLAILVKPYLWMHYTSTIYICKVVVKLRFPWRDRSEIYVELRLGRKEVGRGVGKDCDTGYILLCNRKLLPSSSLFMSSVFVRHPQMGNLFQKTECSTQKGRHPPTPAVEHAKIAAQQDESKEYDQVPPRVLS